MRRFLPLFLLLAAAPPPKPRDVLVLVQTSLGPITLDIDVGHAPITGTNFLRYVDAHNFDGRTFYRAARAKYDARKGFIQGGVNHQAKFSFFPIAHEPTTKTGIKHRDGTISIARLAPGSARGDFTIMVGDQPSLDADPSKPGDNLGYAAFGHVVEGMDVIHKILDQPADPAKGPFKGEMLAAPVKILSAKRVAP